MADCPLADECPSFTERIEGMGCVHYGDRGGAEWCKHYGQPIRDLKSQPVKLGEEVVVDVEDIHESGAGVGRTEDGFIIMVDGVLPPARARVRVTKVRSNYARAEEVERLPEEDEADADADVDPDAEADGAEAGDGADGADAEGTGGEADGDADARDGDGRARRQRLGSRDNFWGN